MEFAKRGCNVVLNDLSDKKDFLRGLVEDISSKGGSAVACHSDVRDAHDIVDVAIERFGGVDILINNAGILRDKSFQKLSLTDWNEVIDVHLLGTFKLCHAVWPIMQQKFYGRIVNVSSGAGLYGNFGQSNYSAAKMGIVGLTKTLAKEGEKSNIKVNCIAPIAASSMTETILPPQVLDMLDPDHITPLVTYLSDEGCETSGNIFELGGGWYSQLRWERSAGVALGSKSKPATAEDIKENFVAITEFLGGMTTHPECPSNALTAMTAALSTVEQTASRELGAQTQMSANDAKSTDAISESEKLLSLLTTHLADNPDVSAKLVSDIGAKVQLDVEQESMTKTWVINLETLDSLSIQAVRSIPPRTCKVLISCNESTMMKLIKGDLSAEYAFMCGDLKIKGKMDLAIKFKSVLSVLGKLL